MRVYLHYEEREPCHTVALDCGEGDAGSVDAALTYFVDAYNRKYPDAPLSRSSVALTDARSKLAKPHHPFAPLARRGGDLFVRSADAAQWPEDDDAAQAVVKAAPMPAQQPRQQSEAHPGAKLPVPGMVNQAATTAVAPTSAAPAAVAQAGATTDAALKEEVKSLAARGEAAFKQKQYRDAKVAFEAVLAAKPAHRASLSRLADIETYCERHEAAAELLQRACDVARATALSSPTTPLLLMRLGDEHLCLGHAKEAVRTYKEALDLCPEDAGGDAGATRRARVLTKLGKALYVAGQRQEGADIWMKVLDKDPEQADALLEYASAALECGQLEDAVKVHLRLIVKKPEDKAVRRGLATALAADGGLGHLYDHLKPAPDTASALAFLGTVLKDHSRVDASVSIYRRVVELSPANASYCLNLVHVLELQLRYGECLEALRAFLRSNGDVRIGKDGPSCTGALRILEEAGAFDRPAFGDEGWTVGVGAGGKHFPAPPALAKDAGEDLPKTGPLSAEGVAGAAAALRSGPTSLLGGGDRGGAEAVGSSGYVPEDLDTLGLLFTATKILFVQGKLGAIAALVNLVEPARAGRKLHSTLIRNEHAYHCCVAQLLRHSPWAEGLAPPAHDRVLHVLGDSHCLSPAWHTIAVRQETWLLRPLLVTGLKMWHLRPESDFYPKVNFANATKAVPMGSCVLCIFGEIDCRESLLLCVERARYNRIEDGAEVVIDIYIRALLDLSESRRLERVYVHAVPPVLDETRRVVLIFNRLLSKKVEAHGHRLQWLEGLDRAMLASEGDAPPVLRPDLKLDGTHMHPRCAELVQDAIEGAAPP